MRHRWTAEDDEYLREHYKTDSWEKLEEHFGVNREAIKMHCCKKGISKGRYFTDEDVQYILNNYGTLTQKRIAKDLGKTYYSIKYKIYKMNLGSFYDNSDDIHLAEVSRMVHRDKETIKSTWVKHGLKITKKGKFSMINQDNLAQVMKNHPDLYDATECDDYFRYYAWFNEKLLEDRKKKYDKGA